jgi:hypothetical protein
MKTKCIKTSFILFILFLSFNNADAQKCKYQTKLVDPMTEEQVRRTQFKLKGFFIVSFYRKGDLYRVELNVRYIGERNFVVPEGAELNLKLPSKSILTFKAAQQATPVSYLNGSNVMTNYAISYLCTKEQLAELSKAGFTVAQAKIGDETLTYEVKSKDVEKTAQKAKCVLEG